MRRTTSLSNPQTTFAPFHLKKAIVLPNSSWSFGFFLLKCSREKPWFIVTIAVNHANAMMVPRLQIKMYATYLLTATTTALQLNFAYPLPVSQFCIKSYIMIYHSLLRNHGSHRIGIICNKCGNLATSLQITKCSTVLCMLKSYYARLNTTRASYIPSNFNWIFFSQYLNSVDEHESEPQRL